MSSIIISDSNRTPAIQITTWFCLVTNVLAFLTHACIKIYTSRTIKLEAVLVFLTLIFSVAQSVAVSAQASNGLGKPSDTLQNHQIEAVLKGSYAATILYFFVLALSKSAIISFIHGLTPKKLDRMVNYGVGAFTVLWLLCSVFVAAFQCKPPHTWDLSSGHCIDSAAWWYAAMIMNIVSEVAIVGLEVAIMIPLQLALKKKLSIIALFLGRILVVVAAAVQLYFFHLDSSGPHKADFTLGYWRSIIGNQIVQSLAIVTITLLYANLFMQGFDSGLIRVDEPRGKGEYSSNIGGQGYNLLDISRSEQAGGISTTKTYTVESSKAA